MENLLKDLSVQDLSFYYDEMVRSNLLELEVETPKGKIVLKRHHIDKTHPLRRRSDLYQRPEEWTAPSPSASGSAPKKTESAPVLANAVRSPIVGTFYRSSSPSSPPFVKEGDSVNAGQTLCIVEAMKVMNEIKSESRCKIVKILGENGKPVSKGQALFQYDPL